MPSRLASFLAQVPPAAGTDAELLTRFARHRDEAAFAVLVERHGPMVLGVCRRVLGDAHAAEDAFQAAFLVLARKAATLPRPEAVAGWLYGVARRVALDSRTAAPVPLPAEPSVSQRPDPLAELTGREILAVLEEEVGRLPADYRLPVVLCCLEGLSLEEAAARLACSTGALRGRLERGRTRLRERLIRRGLVPAVVLAVGGVPRIALASVVTPVLRVAITRAALNFVTRAGAVPAGPRRLAEGVLHAMLATKMRFLAAVSIGTVLTLSVLAWQNPALSTAAIEEKSVPQQKADKPIGTGAETRDQRSGTTVTGRVFSELDGKAVPGVVVAIWNGEGLGRRTARTDETGSYAFGGVKPGDYYRVWIEERPNKEAGCWSEAVVVRIKDRPVRADDLVIQLPQSLSGTVTDMDSGKPVPGAVINFSTADGDRNSITTDDKGRYRLFVTPREVDLYCNGTDAQYEESTQRHKVTVGEGKHVTGIDFQVKSAPPFTGLVVFPDGKPARGADVLVKYSRRVGFPEGGGFMRSKGEQRFKTDDEGRFRGYMVGIGGRVEARTIDLKAFARLADHSMGGVVRATTGADVAYRVDPLKIVLAKSSGLTVRVLNPDGTPVTDADVLASRYLGLDNPWGGTARHEGEGKYAISGLIPGLDYVLAVRAPGYHYTQTHNTFVLKPDEVRALQDTRLDWWGPKAVPGLIKKLQSDNTFDQALALALLGELGADAAGAVPALVEKLTQDPSNSIRFSAAEALGKIGPPARVAVPTLIRALKEDTGGGVQQHAATALGLLGDRSALPALKEALESSDSGVSKAAGEALKRLEEAAKKPRPVK
jgi:RNA polymerase sigma factor (sigma-70 family)